MTAEGSDLLYTLTIIAVFAVLLWAIANLTRDLIQRIQADHYATTFGEDYLLDRDAHRADVRRAMQKARR